MVENEGEDKGEMATLQAAKQQLRSAMKQKLGAISQESVMLQSTEPHISFRPAGWVASSSAKPWI